MNQFLTIYRKDYIPKKVKHVAKMIKSKSEYDDPIMEPFKPHLDLNEVREIDCVDEVNSYYQKGKIKYIPTMEKFITKKIVNKNIICKKDEESEKTINNIPVNKSDLRRENIYNGRSIYQVNYCDIDKELAYKQWLKDNALVLPLDIYIPLTTYMSSYRQPTIVNSKCYDRDLIPKTADNLSPNYVVRDILKINTGLSEYMTEIGSLGKEIIDLELHGPVHHDFKKVSVQGKADQINIL